MKIFKTELIRFIVFGFLLTALGLNMFAQQPQLASKMNSERGRRC